MTLDVPFNIPFIGEEEGQAAADALRQNLLHGDGPISQRVEAFLREWLNIRYAILTTSCTHSLEMAMIALGIGPGDEVIMPSFTFVSTANAVVLRGGTPVFAEIRSDTFNVDPEDIRRKVGPNTRAIVVVHYAGVGCDMDEINAIAQENGLAVVEDAAQGVDAYYKGRPLGTIGDIGCYSFHDTKNITCGEGGAFLTTDPSIERTVEFVREKGTNRSAFIRGEVDKYTWVSQGSSYIQSDILAAVLEAQFSKREIIKARRRSVWDEYYGALSALAESGRIVLPVVPEHCESNYHSFFFRVADLSTRARLLSELASRGIRATFHYVPLHSSPYGREVLGIDVDMPITEVCSETMIRLPLYPQLASQAGDIARVVAQVVEAHTEILVSAV